MAKDSFTLFTFHSGYIQINKSPILLIKFTTFTFHSGYIQINAICIYTI